MSLSRRNFIKKAGAAGAGLMSAPYNSISKISPNFSAFNFNPTPSILQKSFMDLKFGMLIHFGINTYYDKEWSDGTLDPYRVNPGKLDTMQWCEAAKSAGMNYIVLVCKHHDGFCLWPSKHTDYSISRSQYTRDIVASVVNSAEKVGLKVGFYYSLWDQRESYKGIDNQQYLDFMQDQLSELLTGYGSVVELWLDGFWQRQQSGWTKKQEPPEDTEEAIKNARNRDEAFIDAWRMEGAFRWQMDHLYQFVKTIQPDCIIMNNSTNSYQGVPLFPVDARNGVRYLNLDNDKSIWNWLGNDVFVPLQIETTMSTKGNQKFPEGNWFWHAWDQSVMEKEEILNLKEKANEVNANLLLNVGPTAEGILREQDQISLTKLYE